MLNSSALHGKFSQQSEKKNSGSDRTGTYRWYEEVQGVWYDAGCFQDGQVEWLCTKDNTQVMLPPFLYQKLHLYWNLYHKDILYQVEIIHPQILLPYQHTFSTFAWGAESRWLKTLCWSDGAVHERCSSARHLPQNGTLGQHTSASQKKTEVGDANSGMRQNKLEVQFSEGKVMATVFRVTEGVLLAGFLKRGATIDPERYVQKFRKLKQWIRNVLPNRTTNQFLIHPEGTDLSPPEFSLFGAL